MGKKGPGSSRGSGGAKSPNWLPYLAILGLAAAIAAFFTVPGGSTSDSSASTRRPASIAQLEMEMQRLVAGLSAVSERGTSSLFTKIEDMVERGQDVLAKAAAAESEDEKRRILEEGLKSKTDWLMTLQEHAVGLKKDEATDTGPAKITASSGVSVLSVSNFSSFVASNPRTMVEFYAPWCPHCVKFAPEYAACGEEFKGRASFAIVNGEQEKQLSRIYGVGGYPTLKWMVNGRAIDYGGPRTREHLSKWVEERLQPAYVDLESSDDVAAALQGASGGGGGKAVICSGEGSKDSKRYWAFAVAAEHFRGKLVFTWTPSPSNGQGAQLTVHSTGLKPNVCGTDAQGKQNASACGDADEVIAWIDDRLAFDPDLE